MEKLKDINYTCLLLMCICLLTGGCNMSDDYKELSGGYFYRDEGKHTKDILSHLPGRKDIYSEILDYDDNSDFIVAVQRPVYAEYIVSIGFELRSDLKRYPANSEADVIETELRADSVLKNDPYYKSIFAHKINYWIIAHQNKTMYGPLTLNEYLKKRKELDIPDRVNVKED